MSTTMRPFAVPAGGGRHVRTLTGDEAHVMTDTRGTHGALTVMELVISPMNGPGLHSHVRDDEVWFVLEGRFRFKAGDEMFWVDQGGLAFGPRGTPHTFQNVGEAPARLLVITAPAGAERMFDDFTSLLPGPVDPESVTEIARANWVEFIGPKLAESDPL
jgi:mannose-6-phosphate isomerase-like protein (cupin superfamily)